MSGRIRSSHAGRCQARWPSRLIADGHQHHPDQGHVEQDGGAETEPEQLAGDVRAQHERVEDADHDQCRARDDRRRAGHAGDQAGARVPAQPVLLPDPAEQEDLVVHREPEQDREHQHRRERVDRHRLVDAEPLRAPAPLEDGHEDAVRRPDADQVQRSGLERHPHRPEHRDEDQQRQQQHGRDEPRHPRLQLAGQVDLECRVAGDHHGTAVRVGDGRQHVRPEGVDEVGGLLGLRRGVGQGGQHHDLAVRADGRRGDRADARGGLELTRHRRDVPVGVADPSTSTTIWSGPLKPGPKPSASMS